MPNVVHWALKRSAVWVAWRVTAFIWVGLWGIFGLHLWEPVWRQVFYPYTLDGGFVAGFAHAFGLVGFLAGVVVGTMLAAYAVGWWE